MKNPYGYGDNILGNSTSGVVIFEYIENGVRYVDFDDYQNRKEIKDQYSNSMHKILFLKFNPEQEKKFTAIMTYASDEEISMRLKYALTCLDTYVLN